MTSIMRETSVFSLFVPMSAKNPQKNILYSTCAIIWSTAGFSLTKNPLSFIPAAKIRCIFLQELSHRTSASRFSWFFRKSHTDIRQQTFSHHRRFFSRLYPGRECSENPVFRGTEGGSIRFLFWGFLDSGSPVSESGKKQNSFLLRALSSGTAGSSHRKIPQTAPHSVWISESWPKLYCCCWKAGHAPQQRNLSHQKPGRRVSHGFELPGNKIEDAAFF